MIIFSSIYIEIRLLVIAMDTLSIGQMTGGGDGGWGMSWGK